jgi:hypothetical protein
MTSLLESFGTLHKVLKTHSKQKSKPPKKVNFLHNPQSNNKKVSKYKENIQKPEATRPTSHISTYKV